jgi:hypothetical protein
VATLCKFDELAELAAWKSVLKQVLGEKGFLALERAVLDELMVRNDPYG